MRPHSAAFGFDSENSNCTDTFQSLATGAVAAVHTYWTTPQVPGGYGLGTEVSDGRFGHTGQNTGYSCFSFAWRASSTAVVVMTSAEDCRDTLSALIEAAQRQYG